MFLPHGIVFPEKYNRTRVKRFLYSNIVMVSVDV